MTSFNYDDVCNLVSFNYVRILWDLLYYNKNIYLLLIRINFQRLIQNLDSLAAKVLKAKYFKKDDFLSASMGSNSSYVWRSILWGRQVILKGYRWRIGPGGVGNISVYIGNWIPRPSNFKPFSSLKMALDATVSVLIDNDNKWKIELIQF